MSPSSFLAPSSPTSPSSSSSALYTYMYKTLHNSLVHEDTTLCSLLYSSSPSKCKEAMRKSKKRKNSFTSRVKKLAGGGKTDESAKNNHEAWKDFAGVEEEKSGMNTVLYAGDEEGYLEALIAPSDPIVKPKGKESSSSSSKGSDSFDMFMNVVFNTPLKQKSRELSVAYDKPEDDPFMSTLLHQSCRLSDVEWTKTLLEKGGIPNRKDGKKRTALHMAVGGMSGEELRLYGIDGNSASNQSAGRDTLTLTTTATATTSTNAGGRERRRSSIMKRIWKANKSKGKDGMSGEPYEQTVEEEAEEERVKREKIREAEHNRYMLTLLLLSWKSHDPSGNTYQCAVNSVDNLGRTPLHYAAQLGRFEICKTLVKEGAILTVIEEEGQCTPCELAVEAGHEELGAWLEAVAIYEDEGRIFMGDVGGGNEQFDKDRGNQIPYKWFENLCTADVERERTSRIDKVLEAITNTPKNNVPISELKEDQVSTYVPNTFSREQVATLLNANNWNVDWIINSFARDPRGYLAYWNQMPSDEKLIEEAKRSRLRKEQDAIDAQETENKMQEQALLGILTPTLPPAPPIEYECSICMEDFPSDSEEFTFLGSTHSHAGFCKACLSTYISSSAGSGLAIPCPQHGCQALLNSEVVSAHATPEILQKLIRIENDNFVSAASDITYCPVENCQCIVKKLVPPEYTNRWGDMCLDSAPAVCNHCNDSTPLPPPGSRDVTREGVHDPRYSSNSAKQPRMAHRFCWSCKGKPHWPAPCDMIDQWIDKLKEHGVYQEDEALTEGKYEDIAHELWIKANTKPCPNCKTPVEKNDGCNHMTCLNRQCRHDWCWICGKPWDLHTTQTGGYYRCNMFTDEEEHTLTEKEKERRKKDTLRGTAKEASRQAKKKKAIMARFLHYYTRYAAHEQSSKLESSMQASVCKRLQPVVKAAQGMSNEEQAVLAEEDRTRNFEDLSFVHVAFCELVECREYLKYSYVLGYYRYVRAKKRELGKKRSRTSRALESEKEIFEQMQSDLEMLTETLSDIVARQHMRASKTQVVAATKAALAKRSEMNTRQVGILAEFESEVEAKMDAKEIAKRGKPDRSAAKAARASGASSPKRTPVYDDRQASFENGGNRDNSAINNLGAGDLGAVMSAILNVTGGEGDEELRNALSEMTARGGRTRHNPENLSEQDMIERAIQQSLEEERIRELSRPSPPSTPPNEQVEFGDNEIFEDEQDAVMSIGTFSDVNFVHDRVIVPVRMDPFTCSACTFLNDFGNMCLMCNTKRPQDGDEEVPHVETHQPHPGSPTKQETTWACQVCTLLNNADAKVCSACATSRVFERGSKKPNPPPPSPTLSNCGFCGKPCSFRCTGCQKEHYCGRECQLKGWKEHRKVCRPVDAKGEAEGGVLGREERVEEETTEKFEGAHEKEGEKTHVGTKELYKGAAEVPSGKDEDRTKIAQAALNEQDNIEAAAISDEFIPLEEEISPTIPSKEGEQVPEKGYDSDSKPLVEKDHYQGAE